MTSIWQTIKHLNRQRNYKTKKVKNALKIQVMYLLNKKKKIGKKIIFLPDDYQKILLFMHSLGIGDAIVMSGFIHELKKHGKEVSVIAEKKLSFLFDDMINVDEFIEFDPLRFVDFKNHMKNKQFDLIVDFAEMDTTIIRRLRSLLVIEHKYSLSYNQPKRTVFDMNIIDNKNRHISERMVDVLTLLNISIDKYQYAMNISEQIRLEVNNFLDKDIKNDKLIIYNPFASLARRSMSLEQVYILLDFLENIAGYKVIIFDCTSTIDCSKYCNIIMNPFSSFMAAACLVEKSNFVITVDTSIVHLASAFEKPQLAIYNNRLFNNKFINNLVWGPNSSNAIQITTVDHLNTEEGDEIANMDVSLVIEHLQFFK